MTFFVCALMRIDGAESTAQFICLEGNSRINFNFNEHHIIYWHYLVCIVVARNDEHE